MKKLEKTGDLVKAPSRKGDSSQLAVLGGGGVALALLLGGGYYLFGSKTTAVSVGDTATLKRVFYSGEPCLIECSTSRSATVVREAEGELKAGVRTAVLNCHEKLPSGLSTLQRFKLSAWPKGPTVLMAANLEKPQVAPPAAAASGAALAKWANARAAASRTYTDAELKAERERVAKEAREREEQRRAAMAEEEAQAGNVVEEVAEEDDIMGDGDDEEEEEDGEVEEMELDED